MPSSPRKRPRKPKRDDFNKAAFRVVPEGTEGRSEVPAERPVSWSVPTEEETPPPKIS